MFAYPVSVCVFPSEVMSTQGHTCRCPLIHHNLVHTSGRFRSGTFPETKHESSIESYLAMLDCLMNTSTEHFRRNIRNCKSLVSSVEILFGTLNPEPHPTIVKLLIHDTESPLWSLHQTLGCYHSSSSNMCHPTTTKNKPCITNGSTTLDASFLHESILRFWTLEAHFTSFMGF